MAVKTALLAALVMFVASLALVWTFPQIGAFYSRGTWEFVGLITVGAFFGSLTKSFVNWVNRS